MFSSLIFYIHLNFPECGLGCLLFSLIPWLFRGWKLCFLISKPGDFFLAFLSNCNWVGNMFYVISVFCNVESWWLSIQSVLLCHCPRINPWFPRTDLDTRVWERPPVPIRGQRALKWGQKAAREGRFVRQLSLWATAWFPGDRSQPASWSGEAVCTLTPSVIRCQCRGKQEVEGTL